MIRIRREDTVSVMIDFQEKLMPAMLDREELEDKAARLAASMNVLGVPAIVTQQNTKGLGETVKRVREAITADGARSKFIEKHTFSACGEQDFVNAVKGSGKKTVIVSGIETHICVEQTVLDLIEEGFSVVVAADCVSSRTLRDRETALTRMQQAGAAVSTYESIVYEMLEDSKAPEFKAILKIVK